MAGCARLIATYLRAQAQYCDCCIYYVLIKGSKYLCNQLQPANYLLIALKGNSCTENKKYTLISQQSLVNSTYHLLPDIFLYFERCFHISQTR